MENNKFDSWAILEIMGHQKYAGKVSEQAIGGASFVRVDVPDVEGAAGFTKLFGGSSIFCITPVSEEVARLVASRLKEQPIKAWEIPEQYRQPAIAGPRDDDEDEYDDE